MKQKKEVKKKTKKKGEKIKQETMDLLIENSITLQKTLTDLAGDINKLSKDIAEMLNLFKEASKAFTEGKKLAPSEGLREKLDILIEQSRVIAKGLVLLESYIKEKISKKEEEEPKPKPLPQFKF